MTSPILFSKRLLVENIAEYEKLPRLVVVEMGDLSAQFFEDSSWMRYSEFSYEDIVSEILMYISQEEMAEVGLSAFRDDMMLIHRPEVGIDAEDGLILTNAAVKMGHGLLKRLRRLGAYTPEGLFPYIPTQQSNHLMLVLQKYASKK